MSGTLENGDAWFHRWISVETGQSLLQDACQNVALDIPESSLTAPNGHAIPFASPSELRRHTFTRSKTLGASRKAVRRLFEGRGPEGQAASDFQGFLLFDTEDPTTGVSPDLVKPGEGEEWVDIFHNQLPKLLKSKPYCDHFGTIFAKLNGTDPQRKGDKKRGQYKFNKLVRKALTRFEAARSVHLQKLRKAELDLVLRAKDLVARHYERVVLVCKLLIGFFLRVLIGFLFCAALPQQSSTNA